MVDFRPHILKANISISDDTIDPFTGDIIPGESKAIEYACRATPNGAGKLIGTADGNSVVYSYLIHADEGEEEIPFGTKIQVFEGSKLIAEGLVLRFWDNQMNVRIWL